MQVATQPFHVFSFQVERLYQEEERWEGEAERLREEAEQLREQLSKEVEAAQAEVSSFHFKFVFLSCLSGRKRTRAASGGGGAPCGVCEGAHHRQ